MSLSLPHRIHLKRDVFCFFFLQNIFTISMSSNTFVLSLSIESSMTWFNRSFVIVLHNQFPIRVIVEADFSLIEFGAGDTIYTTLKA